jgi:ankyrin repeat protein
MSQSIQELLAAFDGHNVTAIAAALTAGAVACSPVNGKLPIEWLLEQYTRSDRLIDCLRLLIVRGAKFPDPHLAPVLLDDAAAIRAAVAVDPALLKHRTTMVSTFTPLVDVTLLHVAAEYGNLIAARTLIELGADVNAAAGLTEHGLNGHTPLFHTVSSNANRSAPIMKLLLEAGADSEFLVQGIEWGKGFEWETTFFDVTPIPYAQLGLMPQVHRNEQDIFTNIACLMQAAGRPLPPLPNVPNLYLRPKSANH